MYFNAWFSGFVEAEGCFALRTKGSSSFGKVNFTDFARYTSKNRRGAFSITVSSGQNFFTLM